MVHMLTYIHIYVEALEESHRSGVSEGKKKSSVGRAAVPGMSASKTSYRSFTHAHTYIHRERQRNSDRRSDTAIGAAGILLAHLL